MQFHPPQKLLIKSDGNIMEFKSTIPKSKNNAEELYIFIFTKSETKEGKETMFTESILKKLLVNSFIEIK